MAIHVIILGIKPSLGGAEYGWHDGGACLIADGDIVAIAEEERFTREKHAPETFPKRSIEFVLEDGGYSISDVDSIAVGRDPKREPRRPTRTSVRSRVRDYAIEIGKSALVPKTLPEETIRRKVADATDGTLPDDIQFIPHHRSHAASASYCAPFTDCPTLTIDAQGENDSTVYWDGDLNRLKTFYAPNSVGYFFTIGARYLGYQYGWDAGKVMGLAPYGEERAEFEAAFDELVDVGGGEYDVTAITGADEPVALLEQYFGERREYPDEFTQRHKDFAAHLQQKTEEIVTHLVTDLLGRTGCERVALAGGVAMNCKVNREIRRLDAVEDVWIQPAANDSGICLGAALAGYASRNDGRPDVNYEHVYYGPKYGPDAIETYLDSCKLEYERTEDICRRVAELLADGVVVGWFQGRMEFGSRALGNRSILVSPKEQRFMDAVNTKVKKRQSWRPFAPSLLEEAREEYLVDGDIAPFMIVLDEVVPSRRDEIPAVTHVDGTTRPQTVSRSTNERYWRLISEFEDLTGTPVVLNTSFNKTGEPIVRSPEDAVRTYFSTGLDALAIGDCLLKK